MILVTKGMSEEACELVASVFEKKLKPIEDEISQDGFKIYMSPKQLFLLGLPTNVAMAGKPVPDGWCLPDVHEVLKGKYLPLFEKSIERINYASQRKNIIVKIIKEPSKLMMILETHAKDKTSITIDLETNCLDPTLKNSEILTMAISSGKGNFAWGWDHRDSPFKAKRIQTVILSRLKKMLETCDISYHNAKFEIKWLWYKFKIWPNLTHDSMLYSYLLDEHKSTALGELVWEFFPEYAGYEEHTAGIDNYGLIPLDKLCHYNATDTYFTQRICHHLQYDTDLPHQVWQDVLKPVIPYLALMELTGWTINWETYEKVNKWYFTKQQKLYGDLIKQPEIIELVRRLEEEKKELKFSYDQKKRLLFDITKIKPNRKFRTKNNNLSTDADAMEWYADNNPNVKWLQNLKLLSKVNGIRGNELKDRPIMAARHTDDRIHTNYNTHLVVTGRLSSTDPNQQNLPRDTDLKEAKLISIKQIYHTRFDDGILLSADYSQIEMRVAATLAKDEPFMTAYKAGHDVHAQTAELIFGIGWTDADRSEAKTINFSILNDISAYELAINIDKEQDRAQEYIDLFFEAHPALRNLMDGYHKRVLEYGYVETPLGRQRRFIKDLQQPHLSTAKIKHICRQAANFPIQSLASDITLRTVAMLGEVIRNRDLHAVLVGTVHDSIIIDCREKDLQELINVFKAIVNKFQDLTGWEWLQNVPLEIDMSVGKNLSEQYEI